MKKEVILILDFGSPYTQLIAQRIRENHVFTRIVPYDFPAEQIKLENPKGIIFSGGRGSASGKKPLMPEKGIFKLNIPILGICYGAKVIAESFGGRVKSAKTPESGRCELFIDEARNLFWQMPNNITCCMDYTHTIKKLPAGFVKTAHTQDNPIAAFGYPGKKILGVAFHPEAIDTQRGGQILSNFIYKICGCIGAWTMNHFIQNTVENIKKSVVKSHVIINLTGDLYSSVTALLMHKAIGKRLKCVFIDNGLLCHNEEKQVKKIFSDFHLNLKYADRSKQFLQSLKGVTLPEEKKNIVKGLLIDSFEQELKKSTG
ncbi:MAG: glutamine-hydrolyzing GMP synthase, partial [Candidatus Omnitrophota bacterium]